MSSCGSITVSKIDLQEPRNEFQPLLQVNPSDKPAKMANIFIFEVFSLGCTINEKTLDNDNFK